MKNLTAFPFFILFDRVGNFLKTLLELEDFAVARKHSRCCRL